MCRMDCKVPAGFHSAGCKLHYGARRLSTGGQRVNSGRSGGHRQVDLPGETF